MNPIEIKDHEEDNVIPYAGKKYSVAVVAVITVAVIILIICLVNIHKGSMKYSAYDVLNSTAREDTADARYMSYGGGYIRYSNDGIAYFDKNGTAVWNQTYEISNAEVKICGDYVAVGDISGHNIYVFNKSGIQGTIDAALTITEIDVAAQGVVAVALEDGNTNYINLYDVLGTKLITIKTLLQSDGYPLDMALSDDATKLAVSYVSVSGDKLQTNLTFYNFSEIGQNFTERVVGGFNHYGDTLIGKVDFVDNNTVLAVGENIFTVYSIKQYPSISTEVSIDDTIKKIFYNSGYLGMVFENTEGDEANRLELYNLNGKKELVYNYDDDYRQYTLNGSQIIMYNEKKFTLMNSAGVIRYSGTFDITVDSIMPSSNDAVFTVVNTKYIQEIRLR